MSKKESKSNETKITPTEDGYYLPLSYNSKLGMDDPRVRLLSQCIEDSEIKNIAIIGPYGSGKTSIVKSFFNHKNLDKKAIYFSYDTFKQYKNEENSNFDIKKVIYRELLKRDTSSIALSKYLKHLFYFKRERVLFWLYFSIVLLACGAGAWCLFSYLSFPVIPIFLSIFLLLLLVYISFTVNRVVLKAGGKNPIEAQLEFEQKHNLDSEIKDNPFLVENAIIKKLSSDEVGFIVIEDLDRLDENNYDEMVKSLKIMNDLLNHSKEFESPSDRMVFIYCVKDDAFIDSEERTKFFDFIIPVVPYATYSNAADSILTNDFISKNVDKNVVVDLSSYLIDQRQVNALIVEFNVNRQKTYSHDLLSELFALTIFNVRFPSIFVKLYEKNCFLHALIDAYRSNQNILNNLDSASINASTESAIKPFKSIISDSAISEKDKKDLILFIKTCLRQKYITSNFESLLCSNIENELFASDIEYLHSFQAGEFKNYHLIKNPLSVIQHKSDSTYLFDNKKGLNASLIIYLANSKDKVNKIDSYKATLSATIKGFSDEEMNDYISNADDEIKETLCKSINIIAKDYSGIYYAASKIENENVRNEVCFELFNNVSQINEAHKKSLLNFGKAVSNENFLQKYGQNLKTECIVLLNKWNVFNPELLTYLNITDSLRKELLSIGNYNISFENLCTLFINFADSPIHYLINNDQLLSNIKDNVSLFIDILNKSNLKNTSDTQADLIQFIDYLFKKGLNSLLDSNYFGQWIHKINTRFETSQMYFSLFEKGLVSFSESISDLDNIRQYMPDILIEVLEKQSDYFGSFVFSERLSWFIVGNIETSVIPKYQKSLTLTNSVQRLNSIDFDRFIAAFKYLSENEKILVVDYLIQNYPDSFIKLFEAYREVVYLAKNSKINTNFLDCVMKSANHQLLNLCVLPQNCSLAKEYMKNHEDLDYTRMFVGLDGEILKCDDLELIIEYCTKEKRDFKFVRELITSLEPNMTDSFEDWRPFFDSFQSEKKGNYYYFDNNENNNILCQFFLNRNLFKSVTFKGSDLIRCLF